MPCAAALAAPPCYTGNLLYMGGKQADHTADGRRGNCYTGNLLYMGGKQADHTPPQSESGDGSHL